MCARRMSRVRRTDESASWSGWTFRIMCIPTRVGFARQDVTGLEDCNGVHLCGRMGFVLDSINKL